VFFTALGGAARADPALPIKPGTYTFWHRDAEFPRSQGFRVRVVIKGRQITVINPSPQPMRQIPGGVIDEATLMWHPKGEKWILGRGDNDRDAPDDSPCGEGPDFIDFKKRVIWTCIGGP
jgi:hypothetical protein